MTRSLVLVAFFIVTNAVAQIPKGVDIRKSLVRITATSQEQDYKVPWNPGSMTVGVGAGFVIDGYRILTNAHVVSNARFIVVEKEDDPERYPAVVQFVGHDCDLAVLRVLDKGLFRGSTSRLILIRRSIPIWPCSSMLRSTRETPAAR